MITSNVSRLAGFRTALLAVSCVFVLTLAQVPAMQAAEKSPKPAKEEPTNKLPLTVSFDKGAGAEGPQYTLTLKNEGKETIKAKAEILYSVVVHNRPKSKPLPEHKLAAGETWVIPELASMDKVTVKAKGYEALEIVVP
ncbi:hypothetical protein [Opitutus terrae]|uniref:Uncharacterized protein n=1 Tax=Opitutus terrae (strain DSM 11246 / JCM 15787 / PB90-1) TaxID=452637 RepID=B1ZZJ9_OPITP|nr:hypothetical protein [Opitutus terrae]ACB76402.1 hypothetical protein Oter_3122 [Opitutus terrae PB90-1]